MRRDARPDPHDGCHGFCEAVPRCHALSGAAGHALNPSLQNAASEYLTLCFEDLSLAVFQYADSVPVLLSGKLNVQIHHGVNEKGVMACLYGKSALACNAVGPRAFFGRPIRTN